MGSGMSSKEICKDFLIMNNNNSTYKNIEFVHDDVSDYYVIISYALDEYYIPNRTIIFQMEPTVFDPTKNWGTKCWGEWANPDPNKFMHVRSHSKYLNAAQWMFSIPKEINMIRHNKIIAIISGKLIDTGHINRVNFIKYVESLGHDFIDIYGFHNYHNFRNYKGTLDEKSLQSDYKYVFSVENNREFNYATEKIWESFISCSLCFYDGCPNLSDYINSKAFVSIDCSKHEESLSIILNALNNDWWTNRLSYIMEAKAQTINKYNALEIAYKLVNNIS